jgi:2-polyprenyl-3-methyl-5-hydroxy-6-metoxy-1,4-benzoquinol methylase
MSKYNFELDMNSENSNSAILRNIQPNSSILEVGCAHGRMTKYLKEVLNCQVTIVEIDLESGHQAKQWATNDLIGDIWNIEYFSTFDKIKSLMEEKLFDYIIFADVLEHLHKPKEVLALSKELLSNDGSIWISIPNVAHDAVLIDLWNNKFTYRDIGLLDNTHIHFFTYYSLQEMIKQTGFKVVNEINLKNAVEHTEFGNSYDQVPWYVYSEMQQREHNDTYQFVWELKHG